MDQALHDRLGVADALVDPEVWVLGPCCCTGSYVVGDKRRWRGVQLSSSRASSSSSSVLYSIDSL